MRDASQFRHGAVKQLGEVMSLSRFALFGLLVAIASPFGVRAQWLEQPTFAGGAVLVGAQGFARPPITSATVAIYGHLPAGPLLVGAQVSETFLEEARSHARYAIATLAFAHRRARLWQLYPYVGSGAAAFRTTPEGASWRPAFAAGFGVDVLSDADGIAPMFGGRIGYVTRGMSDDESIAYAAIGIGAGARRPPREPARIAHSH